MFAELDEDAAGGRQKGYCILCGGEIAKLGVSFASIAGETLAAAAPTSPGLRVGLANCPRQRQRCRTVLAVAVIAELAPS